jgi:hypothetical protein
MRHSVRPASSVGHIDGAPAKHGCPRLSSPAAHGVPEAALNPDCDCCASAGFAIDEERTFVCADDALHDS